MLLLDVGTELTNLAITTGGNPVLTRFIPSGLTLRGRRLEAADLPEDQAEKQALARGSGSVRPGGNGAPGQEEEEQEEEEERGLRSCARLRREARTRGSGADARRRRAPLHRAPSLPAGAAREVSPGSFVSGEGAPDPRSRRLLARVAWRLDTPRKPGAKLPPTGPTSQTRSSGDGAGARRRFRPRDGGSMRPINLLPARRAAPPAERFARRGPRILLIVGRLRAHRDGRRVPVLAIAAERSGRSGRRTRPEIADQNAQLAELEPYRDLQAQLDAKKPVADGIFRTRLPWDQFLQGLAFVIPESTALDTLTAEAAPPTSRRRPSSLSNPPGAIIFTGIALAPLRERG